MFLNCIFRIILILNYFKFQGSWGFLHSIMIKYLPKLNIISKFLQIMFAKSSKVLIKKALRNRIYGNASPKLQSIQFHSRFNFFWSQATVQINADKDYYKILEVPLSADQAQIKKAYRRLAKKYHPDHNQGLTDQFKAVQQAYQILSNMEYRLAYEFKIMTKFDDIDEYRIRQKQMNEQVNRKIKTNTNKKLLIAGSFILCFFFIVAYGVKRVWSAIFSKKQTLESLTIKQKEKEKSVNQNINNQIVATSATQTKNLTIVTLPYAFVPYSYIDSKNKTLLQGYYDLIYNKENVILPKQSEKS